MLLNYDAAQLEWRAVAHLSQDPVAMKEIIEGLDGHSDNQKKFRLPSRLISKKFLFRSIYCPYLIADETAYAFSVDNDFRHVGNRRFWRGAIESFYDKYEGLRKWHSQIIQEVTLNGELTSETGRKYFFEQVKRRGEYRWPYSDIVNYPVQGFSADLMSIARVSAAQRLTDPRILFINTVHDSITLDVDADMKACYNISIEMKKVFRDIGPNFERLYGKKLLVPMDCDSKVGINWLWMHKINIKEEDLI